MALEVRIGGVSLFVPAEALDRFITDLETKARADLTAATAAKPGASLKDAAMRQAIKAALVVALPMMQTKIAALLPGYPLPDPPRHCDLIAYCTDYGLAAGREIVRRFRANVVEKYPWELSYVESDAGLQVTRIAPVGAPDAASVAATGGAAGSGADGGTSGAPESAA